MAYYWNDCPIHPSLAWGGTPFERFLQLSTMTYTVQKGRVGRHYCKYLTLLFQGVHKRKWNSECPMMYAKLILQITPDVTKSCDVWSRLDLRIALWEKGRIRALVDDVIAEVGGKPQVHHEKDNAAKARS